MYLEHYGLREAPFSITPDPRFVFLSERHRDALAHLLFGIGQGGGGGFVQLTGEVGTGKTTLCRLLLEQLPDNARVALVLNPRLSAVELLDTLCEELHLDMAPVRAAGDSIKARVDALNAYLLEAYAAGLRVVLIIDEAQNLSLEALEQVRLLTNLETDTQKLLQIILLGQPELRDMLARPDMRQLAQRITARFHLTPLDAAETAAYLRHRYRVAGGQHLPFTPAAVRRIHRHAGGVPRLVNVLAERALLGGYAHDATRLDARDVDRAAGEALAPTARPARHQRLALAAVLGAAAIAALLLWPRATPRPVQSPARYSAAVAATTPQARAAPMRAEAIIPRLDAAGLQAGIAATPSAAPAWQALLRAWHGGDALIAATLACQPVVAPGLYCARGTATLDRLVAQGRPALLHLQADGRSTWALLQGADARHARLLLGEDVVDVDRLALQRSWDGGYTALWRMPEAVATPPDGAGRGPAVDWLAAHLPGYRDAPRLGPAMTRAVRDFQRDHGLAVDGVVGPETLLALAAIDPGPGPTLRTRLD